MHKVDKARKWLKFGRELVAFIQEAMELAKEIRDARNNRNSGQSV